MDCVFVKLLTGKLCLCSLKLEFMALKNLVGKIYRCLHEVCTTFGGSTEVQLDGMSLTHFPFTTNQCYFMLNKLKDKLCSSTLLTLISELCSSRKYHHDLWSENYLTELCSSAKYGHDLWDTSTVLAF